MADFKDLKNSSGVQFLKTLRGEVNGMSNPQTADINEALQETIGTLLSRAQLTPLPEWLDAMIEEELPEFIYFENYGVLESAVYIPRFIEDLNRLPNEPRVRTINAMFKHVRLDAHTSKSLAERKLRKQSTQGKM